MNSLTGEEKKKLAKCLDTGCCIKCSLYFINFPTFEIFLKKEKDLNVLFQNQREQKPCPTCLGILQDDLLFDQLIEKTKNIISGYQYDNFLISVYCPHSIILRHHALFLYLGIKPDSKTSLYEKFKSNLKYVSKKILSKNLNLKFDIESGFEIVLKYTHEETDKEHLEFLEKVNIDPPKKKKKLEQQQTHKPDHIKVIEELMEYSDPKNFEKITPPPIPKTQCLLNVECINEPLFITGNYTKYERGVSQTEWFVNNQRVGDNSVGEIIAEPFLPIIKSSSFNFHSSGREDIDVRMLGNGRPFVIEFINPKNYKITQDELDEIQKKINLNLSTNINNISVANSNIMKQIIEGAQEKKKQYRCVVYVTREISQEDIDKLNQIQDLKIFQKTPVRVMHRRSIEIREKMLYSFKAEFVNEHFLVLDLITQAGTYIKEFIHGDLGRTNPSLGTFLKSDCEIIQLDVINLIFE